MLHRLVDARDMQANLFLAEEAAVNVSTPESIRMSMRFSQPAGVAGPPVFRLEQLQSGMRKAATEARLSVAGRARMLGVAFGTGRKENQNTQGCCSETRY
ncbi:MAG TPA: hypothetical protein VIE90_20740 [Candidatus Binatia bacterium]